MPFLLLDVVGVHPEEIAREEAGLVAAGAGPYLKEAVVAVPRILREKQDLQLVLELGEGFLRLLKLLGGEILHLVVGAVHELLCLFAALLRLPVSAEFLDDFSKPRVLLVELAVLVKIRDYVRLGKKPLHFLVTL